jgi:hypothetical protein
MALERIIRAHGLVWSAVDEERIQHHLDRLGRRLAHHSEPIAVLAFTPHRATRKIGLHLRVQLGTLGSHLVSRQAAETADQVVRLAVDDIERQLDREHAEQRGEAGFGVPSRRLPAELRPAQYPARSGGKREVGAEEGEKKPEA